MILFLALLGLSLAIFGGGFFCGFLTFRKDPSIAITLPPNDLSAPIETLHGVLEQFDKQLAQHGQSMRQGMDDLAATDSQQLASGIILKLIAANQDFEQHVNAFAADVHNVERTIASLEGGAVDSGEEPKSSATASESGAVSPRKGAAETAQNNRRTELRHPFFYKQWIAPYSGLRAPEVEEFFLVQCRDISSSGISFFMDRVPTYEMVVIRLAGPDEPRYLTARIQRTSASGNLAYGRYVLGCKFVGSLQLTGLPPTLEESIRRRELRHEPEALAAH